MGKDFTLGTHVCAPQGFPAAKKTSRAVSAKMEPHQQRPSFLDSLQTPGLSPSLPQRPGKSRVSFAMVIPTARWRFPARPAPGCPAAAPSGAAHGRGWPRQTGAKRGKTGQNETKRGRLLRSPRTLPAGILSQDCWPSVGAASAAAAWRRGWIFSRTLAPARSPGEKWDFPGVSSLPSPAPPGCGCTAQGGAARSSGEGRGRACPPV